MLAPCSIKRICITQKWPQLTWQSFLQVLARISCEAVSGCGPGYGLPRRSTQDGRALGSSPPLLLFLPDEILWWLMHLDVIHPRMHCDCGVSCKLNSWWKPIHCHRMTSNILLDHVTTNFNFLLWEKDFKNCWIW